MRTLNRNKTDVWIVNVITNSPILDSYGFKTGEFTTIYSQPQKVKLSLYPSNGSVVEQIFGKDQSYDMLAVSNDVVLDSHTLLFLIEPVAYYDSTYDFRVEAIRKSLNTYNYGLRSRT